MYKNIVYKSITHTSYFLFLIPKFRTTATALLYGYTFCGYNVIFTAETSRTFPAVPYDNNNNKNTSNDVKEILGQVTKPGVYYSGLEK